MTKKSYSCSRDSYLRYLHYKKQFRTIRNNAGQSNIIPNGNFQSKQTGKKDNTLRILGDLTLQARILVKKESIIQKELLRIVLRVMSFTI